MTVAISKITKKNFQDEDVPHELLLTRKQTKTKNTWQQHVDRYKIY